MRMMTFAKRCSKEILRDPINLGFGLGFPLVLLVLLSAIQANIPVSLFEIDTLMKLNKNKTEKTDKAKPIRKQISREASNVASSTSIAILDSLFMQ